MADSRGESALTSIFRSVGPARPRGVIASVDGSDTPPYATQQCDIVFLPHDSQPSGVYKYAFVVADIGSRRVDARPLQDKTAAGCLRALRAIWEGDWLRAPPEHGKLECDDGREFSGCFAAYLREKKIQQRFGVPGRHSQQSLAENANKIIGRAVMILQAGRDLARPDAPPDTRWIEDLPDIVAEINARWAKNKARIDKARADRPRVSSGGESLLPVGTEVRVRLDRPVSIQGAVVKAGSTTSGFRAGDHRWSIDVYAVVDNVLKPGESARYIVKNTRTGKVEQRASYTRQQLQVLTAADKRPPEARDYVRAPEWGAAAVPAAAPAAPAAAAPAAPAAAAPAPEPLPPSRSGRARRAPARLRDYVPS